MGNRATRFIFTDHALRRAQSRGVTRQAVRWTAEFGQRRRAVGGAVRLTMTRHSVKEMIDSGYSVSEVTKSLGTVIIAKDVSTEESLVITVRPTEKNGKKRGGKYKPNYGMHK